MSGLLLGVDIGTQMTKGVLCTPDGQIVAAASASHPTDMPRPGWYEQDAEVSWWGDFCRVVRELLAHPRVRASNIAGVGCSSMTPNTLLLDKNGAPLGPAILYCDARSTEVYPEVLSLISEEKILRLNGFPLTAHGGWQGGQLLWIRRHRADLYRRACKVLGTTNYLVFKLTGEFVADYALAHCNVPFYDHSKRTWSEETCRLLEVPVRLFPERIGYSAEMAGRITAAAARECGLLAGTPVILGAMDTNADMIAAGVTEPGDVGLAYGTALLGAKCLTVPWVGEGVFANDYVVPERYLFGSGVGTGGALTRWFRDSFGTPEVQAEGQGGPNAFAALSELAAQVPPGSDDLIVVPMFGGQKVLLESRLAGGAAIGLTTFHGRTHLYRAILEGTCYETRRQLEHIAPWVPLTTVSSVGGGTQNREWTQIMSNVLGAEQHCFPETAGAPYGDAYLVGIGIGLFTDFGPLRQSWSRGGYVVHVDAQARDTYQRMYGLYLDVIHMLGLDGAH
jgi:xylulokinase